MNCNFLKKRRMKEKGIKSIKMELTEESDMTGNFHFLFIFNHL